MFEFFKRQVWHNVEIKYTFCREFLKFLVLIKVCRETFHKQNLHQNCLDSNFPNTHLNAHVDMEFRTSANLIIQNANKQETQNTPSLIYTRWSAETTTHAPITLHLWMGRDIAEQVPFIYKNFGSDVIASHDRHKTGRNTPLKKKRVLAARTCLRSSPKHCTTVKRLKKNGRRSTAAAYCWTMRWVMVCF